MDEFFSGFAPGDFSMLPTFRHNSSPTSSRLEIAHLMSDNTSTNEVVMLEKAYRSAIN
jgi:hypothetical protein